jgi:AraC-like DNA-binding protein
MQNGCGRLVFHDEVKIKDYFRTKYCFMEHRFKASPATWGIARIESVALPDVDLYRTKFSGEMFACRRRGHIVADSIHDFFLSIPIDERSEVDHAGRRTVCEPGHFRLLSAGVPFSTIISGSSKHDPHSSLFLRLSGAALRGLIADVDSFPDLVLPVSPGAGRLLKSFVETGLSEGAALSAAQAKGLGRMIVDAVADIILNSPTIELEHARIAQSSFTRVQETAKQFIQRNLAVPQLDCAMVADHCQVSRTYLHAAFADARLSVAAYIREMRLTRCWEMLRNPALSRRSITDIALIWGFDDLGTFGRAYRRRYGISPRQDRQIACMIDIT